MGQMGSGQAKNKFNIADLGAGYGFGEGDYGVIKYNNDGTQSKGRAVATGTKPDGTSQYAFQADPTATPPAQAQPTQAASTSPSAPVAPSPLDSLQQAYKSAQDQQANTQASVEKQQQSILDLISQQSKASKDSQAELLKQQQAATDAAKKQADLLAQEQAVAAAKEAQNRSMQTNKASSLFKYLQQRQQSQLTKY